MDLLELIRGERTGVDALDLSPKVSKLGRISRRWERKRKDFDSHIVVV